MKITFLGTGTSQGVPIIACKCAVCRSKDSRDQRLRTSALIEVDDKIILIDAGPDFRQQLLRENITHLDAILVTHEHKDHIAGLDDIRALNHSTGKAIDVYAESRVLDTIRSDFAYAFAENKYPGVPEMELHEVESEVFYVGSVRIVPIRVMHMRLPILGYRINDLTYITDANFISPAELEKVYGSRLFVLNALRIEKHLSHFTLVEALKVASEVNADTTYLTHASHELGFYTDVEKMLPEKVFLAYDGLSVDC